MPMMTERSRCLPSTNSLRWLFAVSTAALFGACDTGRDPPPAPSLPAPPPAAMPPQPVTTSYLYPPSLQPVQGYFSGRVTIGDAGYYAEAVITVDGFVRIHVSGSSSNIYEVEGSVQFIGDVVEGTSQAFGTGTIAGQGCAIAFGRFCAETALAEIDFTLAAGGLLSGEITVATSGEEETWQLDMTWPTDTYLEPATRAFAEGLYYEELAEFAYVASVEGAASWAALTLWGRRL